MQKRYLVFGFLIILLAAHPISACPKNFQRLGETYSSQNITVIIDSFWMGNGHLFLVTVKSPPMMEGALKMFYSNQTTKRVSTDLAILRKIGDGLYRGSLFIENSEINGKPHLQISGRILGSEGGSKTLFKRDMKPFITEKSNQCY